MMKGILLLCFITVLVNANAQDQQEGKRISFGLNYRQASNLSGTVEMNQISPFISFIKNRSIYSLGLNIGKSPERNVTIYDNWPEIVGWHLENTYSSTGIYGGFASYKFFPNGFNKRLNLFIGSTITMLNTVNKINGKKLQNITTFQNTLNIGYNIKINNWISINLAGGAGIALNTAKYRHYTATINENQIFYQIYNRYFPTAELTAGLEFKF